MDPQQEKILRKNAIRLLPILTFAGEHGADESERRAAAVGLGAAGRKACDEGGNHADATH
jgi:hypothetical protein